MRPNSNGTTRLRLAILLAGLVVVPLWLASTPEPASGANPAVKGQWSAPQEVGVVGVHATVLHTGKVLLFFWPEGGIGQDDGTGSMAKLWHPVDGGVSDVSVPYAHDLFCSGHSVLPNGSVFVTGGNEYAATVHNGTDQTSLFDPSATAWAAGPAMDFARWYPSTTSLRDGKVLIFSGWELDEGAHVRVIERYDPRTGGVDQVPTSAWIDMRLYPRTMLLPNGDVLRAGPEAATRRLDTTTWRWSLVDETVFGPRYQGAAVLLPGLDRVLALGGIEPGTSPPHATDTAEILDLSEPTPQWRATEPMHRPRQYMNPVLLPDGDVLVVGGGYEHRFRGPEKTAELFDPETETWTRLAPQEAPRMYHSTAVLLPDARVLSAGQNSGRLQTTVEVFSPPYLFRGPRPVISSAPGRTGYDESFTVTTPDAASIARVALIRPGSVTHSVNFDQRYVDLAFTQGAAEELAVSSPEKNAVAPPGWYMLFLVNGDGVPSIASWVKLR